MPRTCALRRRMRNRGHLERSPSMPADWLQHFCLARVQVVFHRRARIPADPAIRRSSSFVSLLASLSPTSIGCDANSTSRVTRRSRLLCRDERARNSSRCQRRHRVRDVYSLHSTPRPAPTVIATCARSRSRSSSASFLRRRGFNLAANRFPIFLGFSSGLLTSVATGHPRILARSVVFGFSKYKKKWLKVKVTITIFNTYVHN